MKSFASPSFSVNKVKLRLSGSNLFNPPAVPFQTTESLIYLHRLKGCNRCLCYSDSWDHGDKRQILSLWGHNYSTLSPCCQSRDFLRDLRKSSQYHCCLCQQGSSDH